LPEPLRSMIAIIRSHETGAFLQLGADREYRTLEEARADIESYGGVVWRASTGAIGDEQPCFLCGCTMGRPAEARARHPERLCDACTLEAVDEHGRPLRFGNIDLSGGFRSWYADTGENYGRRECFVRGIACTAGEARFGGIVVEP